MSVTASSATTWWGTSPGMRYESPGPSSWSILADAEVHAPRGDVADLLVWVRVLGHLGARRDADLDERDAVAGDQRAADDAGELVDRIECVVAAGAGFGHRFLAGARGG